jgi:hypothetical protein
MSYDRSIMSDEAIACPACGGSGGGPFGPAGSAWDVETYVCPQCEGEGVLASARPEARPLARATWRRAEEAVAKPGPASTRPVAERANAAAGGQKK